MVTPAPGQLQRLLVLDLDIGILALRGDLHPACTIPPSGQRGFIIDKVSIHKLNCQFLNKIGNV